MTISKRKTSYYAIGIDTVERVISMSQWTDMYKQKLMTAEEAVKVVKSGDWVDYGMGTTQPVLLDQALAVSSR